MQTIRGKTISKHPDLCGTPTQTREIIGAEKVSSAALIIGMLSSGITFNVVAKLNGGLIDSFSLLLSTMGFLAVGGLVFGFPAFVFATAAQLRKQISAMNPGREKLSLFSVYRMISWIRAKETVIPMGTDKSGREIQALVTSSFDGTHISTVLAPKAIDLWDQTASDVVKLYELSQISKKKAQV